MGLLRMAARTAVVAGTATAVSGRIARRQARRYDQQAEAAPRLRRPGSVRTSPGGTARGRSVRQGAAAGGAA